MNKPEKKEIKRYKWSVFDGEKSISGEFVRIEDLPSEEEIKQIILESRMGKYIPLGFYDVWNDLAKAISERIRG